MLKIFLIWMPKLLDASCLMYFHRPNYQLSLQPCIKCIARHLSLFFRPPLFPKSDLGDTPKWTHAETPKKTPPFFNVYELQNPKINGRRCWDINERPWRHHNTVTRWTCRDHEVCRKYSVLLAGLLLRIIASASGVFIYSQICSF